MIEFSVNFYSIFCPKCTKNMKNGPKIQVFSAEDLTFKNPDIF